MKQDEIAIRCKTEVEELHRFFVAWFRGTLPETEEAWARLTRALDPSFVLISPGGQALPRAQLIAGIRARHGADGPSSEFEIRTRAFQLRHADATTALATYEEWQRRDGEEIGRLSSVLFALDPAAPNGLRWLHLHETWLPKA